MSQETPKGWPLAWPKRMGEKLPASEMSLLKLGRWGRGGRERSSYIDLLKGYSTLGSATMEEREQGEGRENLSITVVVGGKGKARLSPSFRVPHPVDLNTGFKRRIKNNEDMDRWFLFISTTEEINVTLIM